MVELTSRFERYEGIVTQEVSGSLVLFNMNNGRYFALDDVGARVWQLGVGAKSVSEVIAILARDYDVPLATIRQDVLELFRDLVDECLVVQAGAAV